MKKKSLLITALVLCLAMLLGGCKKITPEDAQTYVQSLLDASYKGEFKDYMKLTNSTEEEAQELYDDGIETTMEMAQISGMEMSEELQEKYRQLFIDMYKNVDYTLSNPQEDGEGFTVDVTVKPYTIFENMEDDLLAIMQDDMDTIASLSSDEEINEYVFQKTYDLLASKMESPEYGDEETITVHIEKNDDGLLTASQDDLTSIEYALFPN